MNNNLLKKFLSFSYGSWIGLVLGVLMTMVTTRILSPEHFGKASMYNLAINVVMIFIIFGTDQSFVRFFYEEEEKKRGGLLYNCIKVPIVLALIITMIILIFNRSITNYLFEEGNFVLAITLVIGIIFSAINRYSTLVIRMKQKSHLFSIIQIANRIVDFVILIIFYYLMGNRFEIIIFSSAVSLVFITVLSVYFERKFWSISNYRLTELKHSTKDVFIYAYPLVLTSLISWLFTSFDKIALKQWSTFTEIGLYSGASRIVALLIVLQGTFTTFWTPVCYERFEKHPNDTKFFERTSKIITIAMLFLAILSIGAKDIIVLLLGSKFKEASNIMPFLVFMPIMYTVSETTVIGINFFKKNNWHILISSVSCIVNIIGNWILVPKLGAKGAAISTAFAYIVFFTMRTQISLKYYKVDYGLKKLYSMLAIIFIYAIYATFKANLLLNIVAGLMVLVLMIIIYLKDLKAIYNDLVKDIILGIKNKILDK